MEPTLFANFRSIIRRYRFRFFSSFFMVLISNILLISNPLILRKAVVATESNPGSLYKWVILLLTIAALASIFKYYMRMGFISIGRDVEREVRLKIFERIQSQSRSFYDRHGIGELLSRLTNDISAYRDVLGPGIMFPMFFTTLIIPGLIALYFISPLLTFVTMIPMLLIPLLNGVFRHDIYRYSNYVQESLASISNMTQEHFSAIRIIKSYVVEHPTFHLFKKLCHKMIGMNLKLSIFQGLLYPVFTLLTKVTTIALVLVSGWIILTAWNDLSAADFVSFMWIQAYIFFPILWLPWVLPIYERGRASYDRLVKVYQEPIEVMESGDPDLLIREKADIAFNHLSFTYPGADIETLKDISLTIKGGSFVGITGPIGSGKTTLFRLLTRDYEIPKGMITIDGRDIHDYPLQAFSEGMVTVEQMPFLFSTTIAENVRFGREAASMDELQLVAKYADLHEAVMEFPEQYETLVGERGVTLSGGQKQRVAMARAFLVERSILLLDDIFSAVDTATEHRIFEGMKKNFEGKTVLLITHRVSILEQLDRVIYMKEGQVVEDGTPEELRQKRGAYSALVELQQAVGP